MLTDATVCDYVRFFFYFVRGDDGAFVLIVSPGEVAADEQACGSGEPGDLVSYARVELLARLEFARSEAVQLTARATESGRWLIDASVAFLGSLFCNDARRCSRWRRRDA